MTYYREIVEEWMLQKHSCFGVDFQNKNGTPRENKILSSCYGRIFNKKNLEQNVESWASGSVDFVKNCTLRLMTLGNKVHFLGVVQTTF